MKILVRLPNWLGDMVMSIGFIQAIHEVYPGASVSVIVKSGLEPLLEYFPPLASRYIFSRNEFKGATGALRFGRSISRKEKFDIFFSLPDSLSAALMGFSSRARERVGYLKEGRSILLTQALKKDNSLHRVEQYITLLEAFSKVTVKRQKVLLHGIHREGGESLLLNVNSEAVSRRLPLQKAVSLLNKLRESTEEEIILIGGKSDKAFVAEIMTLVSDRSKIHVVAGETTLTDLVKLMLRSKAILTTDSGPAHLANACGLPAVVLFGAGNEFNTAPYNKENCRVIRLGQLPCEPCVKNICLLYGIPKCLQLLDEERLVKTVIEMSTLR